MSQCPLDGRGGAAGPSTAGSSTAAGGAAGPSPSLAPRAWVRLSATAEIDGKTVPLTSIDQSYLDEHEVLYGTLTVPVVGCQHYNGTIHGGEMAVLIREPYNQYDPNAICVGNLAGVTVRPISALIVDRCGPGAGAASARTDGVDHIVFDHIDLLQELPMEPPTVE